jgi:general secretion pathway protein B
LSLILDALRRADAERDRGAVPGLHTQQTASTADAAPAPGAPPWRWLALVVATGLVAALVAWVIASREPPRQDAARPSPPAVAAASPSAPSPAVMPAAPPPVAAAAPAVPPAGAGQSQPVAEPAPWPAAEAGRKALPLGVAAASAAPASAEAAVATREQLPQDIRAQLPPLAVGGSIYSANPPDRSVIIDGRLLRENDRLGADLTVEQIRPRSAVLRIKGHRFEIGF